MIVGWINSCKDIANISTINREFYAICCKVAALKDLHRLKTTAIEKAARNGSLALVKWLHETCSAANRSDGCTYRTMDRTVWAGHLDIVKYLHANRSEGCSIKAMDYAAQHGDLEIVKWLHTNRSEGCTTLAMNWAAANGHLEIVKWLQANRSEGCTIDAMDYSASNGNLEIVKWLHTNRTDRARKTRWTVRLGTDI